MDQLDTSDFTKARSRTILISSLTLLFFLFEPTARNAKIADIKLDVFFNDRNFYFFIIIFISYFFIGYFLKFISEREPAYQNQNPSWRGLNDDISSLMKYNGFQHLLEQIQELNTKLNQNNRIQNLPDETISTLTSLIYNLDKKINLISSLKQRIRRIRWISLISEFSHSCYYYIYDFLVPVFVYLLSVLFVIHKLNQMS